MAAFVGCTDGLSGVFDDVEVVLFSKGHDAIHVSGLTEEMDWDDGFGFRGNFSSGVLEVESVIFKRGIDPDWGCAKASDATSGCEEGEDRAEDFVAGLDIKGHECKKYGIGTGANANGMLDFKILSKMLFETTDFFAHDVMT